MKKNLLSSCELPKTYQITTKNINNAKNNVWWTKEIPEDVIRYAMRLYNLRAFE